METYAPPTYAEAKKALLEGVPPGELEETIRTSATLLGERKEQASYVAGDCPCPCPPIITEGVYVVFSPIF
ncbi:hypothetical protein COT48_01285 [Candidatus Woesearchaeota archaeon CG08_land_8_20_14_0_20_47_9]|nr:MAG: hypothetical protein AUJ69_04400 [Candidatus Woesearchaeota archaeon CG1_02_47_18]PIN72761.1 MAG: hypothetical protein COV22_02390 [Candidatus Woesearchaeota archaeon CG10_big_fil_rev_8_21_14_0_10_47_5]PIO04266.1 MAG: hypothetical protein COT48_01285 [Candidatus Woesearchaeota archaeon CG08_land_8_20_14_0_20_47_9]